ncbi:hypothetical protein [uncultured Shewanella sp.]|uniref:hypothetical protein n=1 Tax=uncultured Shewanella sp. TaxID=173975 RepID=UPI002624B6D6|nr:hypothetical protein [uncultured Shewanella sp.]
MIKKTLKIIGVILLLALMTLVYFLLPNEAEKLRSDNNALGYLELLKKAKVSEPNPNVYASSQITPDNSLFEGVLALQRGRYGIAEQKLKPLMEAGDIDAMYWYAETILGSSVYATVEAADLFVKAAELGNPYAALRLTPGTTDCKRYLGYRCSEEWVEKGEVLLKARAEQGDVKAQYYVNVIKNPRSKDDYQRNIDLVTQAANNGYYIPLVDNLKRLGNYKSLTQEKKQALVELLKLAANNNFVPAMEHLYDYYIDFIGDETAYTYSIKAAQLGSTNAIWAVENVSVKRANDNYRKPIVTAYQFALIENELVPAKNIMDRVDYMIRKKAELTITEAEKQQARLAADEFMSQMTPVIYIDELHPQHARFGF